MHIYIYVKKNIVVLFASFIFTSDVFIFCRYQIVNISYP